MNRIDLKIYSQEDEKKAVSLIQSFWFSHNDYKMSTDEAKEDLIAWTAKGHTLYLIKRASEIIGFAHMGSRGCEIDWLEDLFILPVHQGKGYGSEVIRLLEEIVKEYSESLYIEVAARNQSAAKLYRKLGYNVLNTITVRKDFRPEKHETISEEEILGYNYVIRRERTEVTTL